MKNQDAILIADDNAFDVEAVKCVFEEANVLNPVRSVNDGAEVIAYLQGEGNYSDRKAHPYPILLLLDMKMPRRSGLETLQWIRRQATHKELRVIALTGINNLLEVRKAYQLGAHSFLIKPISAQDCMNLVTGLKGLRLENAGGGYYIDAVRGSTVDGHDLQQHMNF